MEAFPAPRWFWYQRFHHLLLDGFSFTVLTAHIVAIYQALLAGEAPPASPFTSFAAVVEEYLAFNGSEAEQKSREFWLQHARDQAAPVSLALPEEIADAEAVLPLQQHFSLEGIDFRAADGQAAELLMAGLCLYFGRMSGERRLILRGKSFDTERQNF